MAETPDAAVDAGLDPAWRGLVDDAAIFPPGDAPLHEASAAFTARTPQEGRGLVGRFVVRDTDLPLLRGFPGPLTVVVTGGAGQLAGPVGLAARLGLDVVALELAVRDLDDPAGNVRRIVAALHALQDAGTDLVPTHVELPAVDPTPSWLDAADALAEAELALKLRTGGETAEAFPPATTLAHWVDAALDRELPFKATAGLHHAVRHTGDDDGFEHHGFLNLLVATRVAFDGGGSADVVDMLERRDGPALAEESRSMDLAGARRWFTCFGSCSVAEPWADLRALGLVASGVTA